MIRILTDGTLGSNTDGTLGDAVNYGPNFRDVVILVSGYQASSFDPVSASGVQDRLNNLGWIIDRANYVGNNWIPGITGFSYRVYAVVNIAHSQSEIRTAI